MNSKKTQDISPELFLALLKRLQQITENEEAESFDISEIVAFLWNGAHRRLYPIQRPVAIDIDNLLNIEEQKKKVLANTTNFIKGRAANNVLLWGEKGTGKSSLIKGLLKKFSPVGLRMIQVFNQDINTIHYMYDFIYRHSYYRFIIFIDDLSFEKERSDYKALKTIMDGGLQEFPENLLFYATSNRRHLIPTKFSDSESDLVRPSDDIEEKISLSDRFGLRLGFYRIDEDSYLKIVQMYASKYKITIPQERLQRLAIEWSIQAGGRNGRIAEQFIKSL